MKNYAFSYNEMGNLYQIIDIKRAIEEYKRSLNLEPMYSPSRLNLGFVYINKKDYKRAEDEFKRILKEDPSFNPYLIHYGFGLIYQNKGDFKKAFEEYTQALRIDKENALAKKYLEECKKCLDKNKGK